MTNTTNTSNTTQTIEQHDTNIHLPKGFLFGGRQFHRGFVPVAKIIDVSWVKDSFLLFGSTFAVFRFLSFKLIPGGLCFQFAVVRVQSTLRFIEIFQFIGYEKRKEERGRGNECTTKKYVSPGFTTNTITANSITANSITANTNTLCHPSPPTQILAFFLFVLVAFRGSVQIVVHASPRAGGVGEHFNVTVVALVFHSMHA